MVRVAICPFVFRMQEKRYGMDWMNFLKLHARPW